MTLTQQALAELKSAANNVAILAGEPQDTITESKLDAALVILEDSIKTHWNIQYYNQHMQKTGGKIGEVIP